MGLGTGGIHDMRLLPVFFTIAIMLAWQSASSEIVDDPLGEVANHESGLRIFFDCGFCDQEYARTQIPYVNFVRDREIADVHVLVTRQQTGGGGQEYTVEFIGRRRFTGMTDTLKYFALDSDTEETIRSEISRTVKSGLVRFAARTSLSRDIEISVKRTRRQKPPVDKWDHWVLSLESLFNAAGQRDVKDFSISGTVEVLRITDRSIIWGETSGQYEQTRYSRTHGGSLGLSRSRSAQAGIIWSAGDRWGVAAWSELVVSTYSNKRLQWTFGPAVEYNLFSYKESTRRQIRTAYELDLIDAQYQEETVFGKTREWLACEKLSVDAKIIQPWGTVEGSIAGSDYLHDPGKYRFSVFGKLSLRVVEGLSVNFTGNGAWFNDQLSLRKSGASEEEVISGRRELPTTYNYSATVGLNYTFGSIYNNIVNARFGF
jgi:hypothetical protein